MDTKPLKPKRKKTGGRDFKPGQSGNPKGRPKQSPELKAFLKMSKWELMERLAKHIMSDQSQLYKEATNPETSAFDALVAKVLMMGIKDGNHRVMAEILDRFAGKVRQEIHVTSAKDLSDEELEEKVKEVMGESTNSNT